MKSAKQLIEEANKIVIKLGSNTISGPDGRVNRPLMSDIIRQVCAFIKEGKRVMIVSSGAGICGVSAINKWSRKGDINYKQALCAIGQVELMNMYKELFGEYGIHVAQILLTSEDFHDHTRELNIRNAMFTLVDEGVVPIINENDSVSVDQIKIGDNDTLGALTANLWAADLLILLSDIDGVYDKDPNTHEDAVLIEHIRNVADIKPAIDMKGKSRFGTGGIVTKLHAAEMVNEYGISMILANSHKPDILNRLAEGQEKATVFCSE